MNRHPGTLLIACFLDGLCVGNCQVSLIGGIKTRHRATVAIGIREKYCSRQSPTCTADSLALHPFASPAGSESSAASLPVLNP